MNNRPENKEVDMLKENSAMSIEDAESVDELDEADEIIPFTYSITSYGADYPVDSIVKRMESKDIVIPRFSRDDSAEIVNFQREYVWPKSKADRFIESLLLGLPVPGIFLVKEQSGRLLVLDGHQRLYTLQAFCKGIINGREYRLDNVQDRFAKKSYSELDIEDRRRLDDSIIHAIVVRQDEPSEDQSSIYAIFERLNTGGVNLQPQEIRVALYHGKLVRVLEKLNDHYAWRKLFGKKSLRLKDMELILRFFALLYRAQSYKSPMKDFLNRYMASNRDLSKQSEEELSSIFESTTNLLMEAIGERAFRPVRAVNVAVVDSVLTGVAKRLKRGPIKDHTAFSQSYDSLIKNPDYRPATERGTSQEANVQRRLQLAEQTFANIP